MSRPPFGTGFGRNINVTEEGAERREAGPDTAVSAVAGDIIHRAGFVAVLGAPNVGKSSLVNALTGRKVAGVSPRPQTTRRRILGVRTESDCQAVLVDTPGCGEAVNRMGEIMRGAASAAARESDVLLYVIDASRGGNDDTMKSLLSRTRVPVLLAINKIDLVAKTDLLPLLERLETGSVFEELVPVSAKDGDGVGLLFNLIKKRLPEGPRLFDEAVGGRRMLSPGLVQEVVQEKLFSRLWQEVPYGCAVLVESAELDGDLARISAVIITERESHKPILIGAGGSMLKEIGSAARVDLESLLGLKVFLKLLVKVEKDWRNRESLLGELGISTFG
jgi:GTP-binding protein Era